MKTNTQEERKKLAARLKRLWDKIPYGVRQCFNNCHAIEYGTEDAPGYCPCGHASGWCKY